MDFKTVDGAGEPARRWQGLAACSYWELLCIPLLLIYHRLCYNLTGAWLDLGSTNYAPLLLTGLDTQIPYVSVFVLPYLFVWGYAGVIAFYALYFRTYDHLLFRYFYFSFLLMTGIECLIWLSFPAKISIRIGPEAIALSGWLGDLTAFVYNKATPWNVFPSAHVAFGYAGWVFSKHFARQEHRWLFLTIFVLITLSVLFIKNHFLWDIVGGMLVVQLIYHAVFMPAYHRRLLHGVSAGVIIVVACIAAAIMTAISYTTL